MTKVWQLGQQMTTMSNFVKMHKSWEDKRSYRGFVLENGLKVVVVSDPLTDKAAAALDVHVGHMSDPWELPGLAHFCEHMLFLGTAKYPDENEYSRYLSQSGGSANAYTDTDHTNFYFDVSPQHLEGAVDRFAQFFVEPLFTESATEREVQAVNSENENNQATDEWRQQQIERSLSTSGHDYGKFGTGNVHTLAHGPIANGINVREELLKFHDRWYSSNLMSFVILGNQSLDELEAMVRQNLTGIKNKAASVAEWLEHPYGAAGGVITHTVPVKDVRLLKIVFPIPDYTEHYKDKPAEYVAHLIGHEGKGSLLSELKALGYVNSLVSGAAHGGKGFGFFYVSVDLTELGLEHTDDVIRIMFQYFALLRRNGVQEWIFNECKLISQMNFRFKDKERPQDLVRILANHLHDYPMEDALSGPWLMENWNPLLIKELLQKLEPENVFVFVASQKFESIANSTEKWYGTKYSSIKISIDKLQSWTAIEPHPNLRLPPPNEFIPSNFELVEREPSQTAGVNVPKLLQSTPFGSLWFKQDTEFLLPKAYLTIQFESPFAYIDPHYCNLTAMYVRLVNDALTELTYDAELAGLRYSLSASRLGLMLTLSGYHEKQVVFLDKLVEAMLCLNVEPKRFDVLKEAYVRELTNFGMEQPYILASHRARQLTSSHVWSTEQILASAEQAHLCVAAMRTFIPLFFSKIHVVALAFGNVSVANSLEVMEMVESRIRSTNLDFTPCLPKSVRQLALTPGTERFFVETNKVRKSSCILTLFQIGLDETESNVRAELFAQIIHEPCFDILRTKEQLGYIVYSNISVQGGIYCLQFTVQSSRSPAYLESRIEEFLTSFRHTVEAMSEEEFQRHKVTLIERRLEKPKKMRTRDDKMWREISNKTFNFERASVEVAALAKLSLRDMLDFYDSCIAASARRKLSVHIVSVAEAADEHAPLDHPNEPRGLEIVDVDDFKKSLPLHPLPRPFGVKVKSLAAE